MACATGAGGHQWSRTACCPGRGRGDSRRTGSLVRRRWRVATPESCHHGECNHRSAWTHGGESASLGRLLPRGGRRAHTSSDLPEEDGSGTVDSAVDDRVGQAAERGRGTKMASTLRRIGRAALVPTKAGRLAACLALFMVKGPTLAAVRRSSTRWKGTGSVSKANRTFRRERLAYSIRHLGCGVLLLVLGCEGTKRAGSPVPKHEAAGRAAGATNSDAPHEVAQVSGEAHLDGTAASGGSEPVLSASGGAGSDDINWRQLADLYGDASLWRYVPGKDMIENLDEDQVASAVGHWKMIYSDMLGRLVLPVTAVGPGSRVPKDLLLRRYHTEKMTWFLTTQNVQSYEQQLTVAQKFFGEATRFSLALPCELIPPIAGPGGTKVDCPGVFETKWSAPVSPDWEGCQAKDVPAERNSVLHGAPGTMEVTRRWTAEMHLAESGQVDEFHLIPAPPTVYTVNAGKTVACATEPHWDARAPGVTSISIGPGERMEQVGPRVWCSSAQGQRYQMEVRWQDETCWVETFAVTRLSAA